MFFLFFSLTSLCNSCLARHRADLFISFLSPLFQLFHTNPNKSKPDGYLTYHKNNQNKNIATICGISKSRTICLKLATAGIASITLTILFLMNLIITMIALIAKPLLSTSIAGLYVDGSKLSRESEAPATAS